MNGCNTIVGRLKNFGKKHKQFSYFSLIFLAFGISVPWFIFIYLINNKNSKNWLWILVTALFLASIQILKTYFNVKKYVLIDPESESGINSIKDLIVDNYLLLIYLAEGISIGLYFLYIFFSRCAYPSTFVEFLISFFSMLFSIAACIFTNARFLYKGIDQIKPKIRQRENKYKIEQRRIRYKIRQRENKYKIRQRRNKQ